MLKKLLDPNKKILKRLGLVAEQVISLKDEYKKLSDDELKSNTEKFKERYQKGESLDSMIVEVFATVREAAFRVIGQTAFKTQLMGAIAIHEGNIAEMKTGEGKTLTAVFSAYLNALSGNGVHIVTVNEYLAGREANGEIGDIFRWLGLTVGLNIRDLSKEEKREVYNSDILYSTNNELGFDYLRDHMVIYKEQMTQRPLNFAIIDEVDSILIDEARTPLIISGGEKNTQNLYLQSDRFVRNLRNDDYEIDVKAKSVILTESGMSKAERVFNIENLYDLNNVGLLHHINNALKANFTMDKDVDYVVQENSVIIVDQFTGRLMHGRQFSEGLHQALEAKESVEIKKETSTLATITFQNFFRMYKKLAGMTGTAKTEEEEFRNIYNMYVVEVPTNRPIVREDANDLIFATMQAKFKAIADEIAQRYKIGQPILVGTISIESSELLSKLLKKKGIRHSVLNAKQHGREAEIVENAGKKGSVTIATNMAGRGTDIKLGEGVKEVGGLAVLGTERHESRRIDNQLRGRSGRQGDPGYSRFFLSGEDELVIRFGGDRFKNYLRILTQSKDNDIEKPLDFKMFSKMIERAQRQIEGNNFDRRKTVLQYDEVLRRQREIIYKQRKDILFFDNIEEVVVKMIESNISGILSSHYDENKGDKIDSDKLFQSLNGRVFNINVLDKQKLSGTYQQVLDYIIEVIDKDFVLKKQKFNEKNFNEFLKAVLLRVVDTYWVKHIDSMSELRQGIGLQSYAQMNPFREYQETGFRMFEEMVLNIESDVTKFVLRAHIRDNLTRVQVAKPTSTSSGKEDDNNKRKPIRREKVGRNEPCPCGSGKKYKHCHGK